MKIQGLAVLAMVIILPMSIILGVYSTYQIKTLRSQVEYDTRLKNATYDAIKIFQTNMSNSSSNDIVESKLRDMNAAIKTFYNSLASHFNMAGYGEDVLQEYVPAIVFTLYDGYYIYSAYTNTLNAPNSGVGDNGNEKIELYDHENTSYKENEVYYGLKPYVYYSCRYKRGTTSSSNTDFVITYSLDNYITVQGMYNGNPIDIAGYVLNDIRVDNPNNPTRVWYNDVEILEEVNSPGLRQNVYDPDGSTGNLVNINGSSAGSINEYEYSKVNGVKYYKENDGQAFSILNDVRQDLSDIQANNITNNKNGKQFYIDAYKFTNSIRSGGEYDLSWLETSDACDEKGNKYPANATPYANFGKIFDGDEEKDNSNFKAHKLEVVRNSIETNLGAAISNYRNISTSLVSYAMPRLQDTEWEIISNNVTMITFLQGLSIGGKIYNGHAIVPNTLTEDFVSEEAIYMTNQEDGLYYRVTDPKLTSVDANKITGLLNTDFERKTSIAYIFEGANVREDGTDYGYTTDWLERAGDDKKKNIYYYPRNEVASYSSIINPNGIDTSLSTKEYVKNLGSTSALARLYYTALGRERYGLYRVHNEEREMLRNVGLSVH